MDPMTIAALGQLGIAGYNAFSGNRATKQANRDVGQIQGYGNEAYNPFINQGQAANQQLTPQYQQMAFNPAAQYNDIMGQYQPSAGYQHKQKLLQEASHNTAASGGYLGTEGDIARRNEMLSSLLGEDMQQFLANILGIQGQGMQGLQHQGDIGYHAAGSKADYLGSAAGQQGVFGLAGQGINQSNRNDAASILAGLIGGGKKQPTQYNPLTSQVPNYMQGQGSMASHSLFGGYG